MKKNKIKINEETIEEKQKNAQKDIVLDYLPYLVIILTVIIIRTFIATPIRVNGTSMDTTLIDGETMILNKLAMNVKGIKRFDIVVVRAGEKNSDNEYIIKRVIGLPGESVKYTDGKLFINNQEAEDKYSLSKTEDFEEVFVGQDEYFVLGDNRFVSQDSRMIGPVSKDSIIGKTNIVLFPFSRFGIVE